MNETKSLLISTTRLQARKGNVTSVGTGFYFYSNKLQQPFVVTNKHVVSGMDSTSFTVHTRDSHEPEGIPRAWTSVEISHKDCSWIGHPDPEIDLCAIPFHDVARHAAGPTKKVIYSCFEETHIGSQDMLNKLGTVEPVTMTGYPIGLWDDVNNFPISRRGSTATHPAVDFKGKCIGVVDMACFPGSSGSPICLEGEILKSDNNGGLKLQARCGLLGVLYAGPIFSATGTLQIRTIPTAFDFVPQTQIPTHLGFYIKAQEILALIDHAEGLLKRR